MTKLDGLGYIVSQLRVERTNLVNHLQHIDAALSVLEKVNSGLSNAKPRRPMSASARKKIAAAQRARWARFRRQQKLVPIAPSKKSANRTLSVSARHKIAAAQRARWAKVRAKHEKKAA
jgi:hypothetical protein